jgi:uncharacterized protein DUF2380
MVRQRRRAANGAQPVALGFLSAGALCASLLATSHGVAAPAPIKLAVFEFELQDFSAGASSSITPADAAQLASVTQAVRDALTRSGRYTLIDLGNLDAPAVKTHTLRDCNGCDAGIASKLGAQQSLVGVVSRISRTEYTILFQVRDTQTGAVVASADSGLRMGADYSWSRGASQLVRARLLETAPPQ